MKAILNSSALYQAYQNAGGFFGARVKAISDYLTIRPGMRVIDIGCGPGYILRHLPRGIDYVGFDIDEAYVGHARRSFGDRGKFHCRYFDAATADEFAGADIVMMNGVLHHIADEELKDTLSNVRGVLKSDGVLFTLDGCYREGQSRLVKWLLRNDRGEFVRDQNGYDRVLRTVFGQVDLFIREDYSRVPYTFIIGTSRQAPAGDRSALS
jgi:SAM-dependent methyltransferase